MANYRRACNRSSRSWMSWRMWPDFVAAIAIVVQPFRLRQPEGLHHNE